jgi:hypothetical protein
MAKITRQRVEKDLATASKSLLDYIDQQDADTAKAVEDLKNRVVAAATKVNKMIDDASTDEAKTEALRQIRDIADLALGKVRGVIGKVNAGEPVSVQEIQSANEKLAEVEDGLEKLGLQPVATTTAAPSKVNPKSWGGLAWALAVVGFIIGGVLTLSIGESFFPNVPAPLQWLRWATLLGIPVFSFFAGGAFGSFIESKQSVK